MITTREMRTFASECLRWADDESNPSHRETIFRAARVWFATANMIERALEDGDELRSPDLRSKLN